MRIPEMTLERAKEINGRLVYAYLGATATIPCEIIAGRGDSNAMNALAEGASAHLFEMASEHARSARLFVPTTKERPSSPA